MGDRALYSYVLIHDSSLNSTSWQLAHKFVDMQRLHRQVADDAIAELDVFNYLQPQC